ncbi:MAG: C45 family autoproteolytic acyltransferase/hydrolase [Tepidisphaeraceae bacterium]
MRRIVVVSVVALFVGISGVAPGASPATVPVAAARTGLPFPVVHLRGGAAHIASDHAQALADPIKLLHKEYLQPFFRNASQRAIAETTAMLFAQHLRPEHWAEVKALADTTGLDLRQIMLAQCFLDLSRLMACSTVTLPAGAAPDGVARFGRNLDFPTLNIADKHSVVLVYHPEDRYQFAVVGWPGMVGVLSGMNEHGLALANMEVARSPRYPAGMPYTLLYRSVLERCRTVDEAVALLEKTPRQTANNLMLMDATGARAVIELTPADVIVRRGADGTALISTNHQRDQDAQTPGRCRRYDSIRSTSAEQFGKIDAGAVQRMLAEAAQGNMTMQSMVFEPSTLTMYLAVGANAPRQTWHRIDLREYFR